MAGTAVSLRCFTFIVTCSAVSTDTHSHLYTKERHVLRGDEAHLPALWCYAQFSKHLQHLFSQRVSVNERCSSLFVNLVVSRFVLLCKSFPVMRPLKMRMIDSM